MEPVQKSIVIYSDAKGREPLSDWLESLKNKKARAAVMVRIGRMAHGNFGDHASVGDGVHELRIHLGPGYRVYFGTGDEGNVILICGGNKRSQRRDVEKAKRILREYQQDV